MPDFALTRNATYKEKKEFSGFVAAALKVFQTAETTSWYSTSTHRYSNPENNACFFKKNKKQKTKKQELVCGSVLLQTADLLPPISTR